MMISHPTVATKLRADGLFLEEKQRYTWQKIHGSVTTVFAFVKYMANATLGRAMRKRVFRNMRTAKAPISPCIRAV